MFEDAYTAWVAHAYKGLFRVKFNKSYDSILSFKNYRRKGLLSDFNVKLYKIKNDICFKTNKGWQKYEALIDSIVPHKLLDTSLGKDANIISEYNTHEIVTKSSNDKINFVSLNEDENIVKIPNRLLAKRLVVDAESVSKLNDTTYTFNLYDGFILINKISERVIETLHTPTTVSYTHLTLPTKRIV